MKLDAILPEHEAGLLAEMLEDGEKVRFSLASDMTLNRRFGEGYIVVTDKRVVGLDPKEPPRMFLLDDLKDVRVDELFGSGRLLAVTEQGERTLIFYSKAFAPEFAVMARVMSDLLQDRKPELPEEDHPAYCPQCGCPMPQRAMRCPLCVPRLKVFMRLIGLLRPYRGRAFLLMGLTLVMVASQMGPPYITKMIVDDVIRPRDTSRLWIWAALMLSCGLLRLFVQISSGTLTAWLGGRLVADLRAGLHSVLQRLQMRFFSRRETGEIISRVMHDTMEVHHFLIDGAPYFLVNTISFIAIAGVLFYLDWRLTVLVFIPVPFLIGGGRWFWRKLMPMFHKHRTRVGALHSVLSESVQGIKSVKALSRESGRAEVFDGTNEGVFDVRVTMEQTWVGFSGVMTWIMSVGVVGVWYFGAGRIARGDFKLTLGELLAFVGYIWLLYMPMQWFTAILNWMTHAFASAERIFGVLDSEEETYDAPDAIEIPHVQGAIGFHDVHFSYERGKEVIKGVTFDIAAGEMVGLVGKSGAGKSTIINLICRFYDADSGHITIDGHPINHVKLEQLRRQIGMVMQEPFLFNASILENIRSAAPEAEFEQVVRAAKAANAHDFIINKEDGYDTLVGERGTRLSGGEKQRIAIAQAILHDPPILILDEATSSVDTETEKAIQEAMTTLVKGRTTIAIAHRLSTLRNAHRLVVLDDGKLAEIGTHDELMKNDGIFARLVNTQSELTSLRGEAWKG